MTLCEHVLCGLCGRHYQAAYYRREHYASLRKSLEHHYMRHHIDLGLRERALMADLDLSKRWTAPGDL